MNVPGPAGFLSHPTEPLEASAEAHNYNAWIFDRARPHLGRRVLDFGAGFGIFTELAAETGVDVVAFEPDVRFAEDLRARFADRDNVRVTEGPLEDVSAEAFDSIMCFNVLEHIADDAATVRSLREQLDSSGRLLLLVPAHPFLYGDGDRFVGHYRRYERRPLRALLERNGFDVESLRHVNPVGAIGWFVRLRRLHGSWPKSSYRAYDRLVPLLRQLDRLPLPVGLSIWAVARRR